MYDESYRKALKMDTANFVAQFDPALSGLIKTIEENLLQGKTEIQLSIQPEIYKLNVYGRLLRYSFPPSVFLTFSVIFRRGFLL